MNLKKILNYSPNFSPIKRKSTQVKFIIFHYTGMRKETDAINRLINTKSEVSSHYLIKNNGEIITFIPDLYVAWHAGISFWKNFKSLNKYSIGIEISNPGHDYNYKKFSKKQINSLLKLSKYLIKKYKISPKNVLGHSDIAPERKKDPGEKFPWKLLAKNHIGLWHNLKTEVLKKHRGQEISNLDKKIFLKNISKIGYLKRIPKNLYNDKFQFFLTQAFQRRFRQEKINGKIDSECLLISQNLIKKF